MSFIPGPSGVLDISSVNYGEAGTKNTVHRIFITNTYNKSTISLKAFIDSLSYDINKKVEENHNATQDNHNFASYNGSFGIQISLSVPAANVTEAKNNYAKISHLQNMILGNVVGNKSGQLKDWQIVHLSNLINNGSKDADTTPENYGMMKASGLQCIITEVDYAPDFSVGFLKDSEGGLYPKIYVLKLTLNPDSERRNDDGRKFLHSFNENGQYNNNDSCFFPFLARVGKPDLESTSFHNLFKDTQIYDLDNDNKRILKNAKDSYIYVSLPITKNHEPVKVEGGINHPKSTNANATIRRDLVFEAFMETFSRKFSNNIQMEKGDADNPIMQTHAGGTTNSMPPHWKLDFTIPAANMEQSYINCGKVQQLMRIFLQRSFLASSSTETRILESVRIFVPSFIGHSNSKQTTLDNCYNNGYTLQLVNLSIEVDVGQGFFFTGGKYYPKAFKISLELKDVITQNYRKIQQNGSLIKVYDTVDDGEGDTQQVERPGTIPEIDNNPSRKTEFVSNVKYWSVGS